MHVRVCVCVYIFLSSAKSTQQRKESSHKWREMFWHLKVTEKNIYLLFLFCIKKSASMLPDSNRRRRGERRHINPGLAAAPQFTCVTNQPNFRSNKKKNNRIYPREKTVVVFQPNQQTKNLLKKCVFLVPIFCTIPELREKKNVSIHWQLFLLLLLFQYC